MKFLTALSVVLLLWMLPQHFCIAQKTQTPKNPKTRGGSMLNTALLQAAKDGNTDTVKSLLARGAFINATDREGNTPLHCAADEGSVALAKLLLDRGADYRIKNRYGSTPLWLTGRKESPATVSENRAIAKLIGQRMASDKRKLR